MEANKHLLIIVFMALGLFSLHGAPLAEIIYIGMDCGNGGEVEIQINGDPEDFTYFWQHGPTDLRLTGLDPGVYVFVIRNEFGCEEQIVAEITDFQSCQAGHQLTVLTEKCKVEVSVQVVNPDTNEPYDLSNFTIVWADDPQAGFERVISQTDQNQSFSYEVFNTDSDGSICCTAIGAFTIPSQKGCEEEEEDDSCDQIVVVNEFKGSTRELGSFVEILVVGECICGEATDLRGYILDDNNGFLIKGNTNTDRGNRGQIGIDPGYLIFNYNTQWGAVPNGSLILIYGPGSEQGTTYPTLDPTDADADGVYVLAANDDEYFGAQSGNWNDSSREQEYGGQFLTPDWSLVKMSAPADGVQLRDPNAILAHGVSTGISDMGIGNGESVLHLDDRPTNSLNCSWIDVDIKNLNHYSCVESISDLATPGLPNSPNNAAFIESKFKLCDSIKALIELDPTHPILVEQRVASDKFKVYPNPFQETFSVEFNTQLKGISIIRLHDSGGKLVYEKEVNSAVGLSRYHIRAAQLPAGMYLLELTLPSGVKNHERIVRLNN